MKKTIVIIIGFLGISWSFWGMWRMSFPRIDLGIAEQRKIYSSESVIYLDNKPLPYCSEDIETRICTYSCAPDGICVFVPKEIIDKYNFNKPLINK